MMANLPRSPGDEVLSDQAVVVIFPVADLRELASQYHVCTPRCVVVARGTLAGVPDHACDAPRDPDVQGDGTGLRATCCRTALFDRHDLKGGRFVAEPHGDLSRH